MTDLEKQCIAMLEEARMLLLSMARPNVPTQDDEMAAIRFTTAIENLISERTGIDGQ